MTCVNSRKAVWALAAMMMTGGLAGAYAQPVSGDGWAAEIVKELELPDEKTGAAQKLVDGLLGQIQESGRNMLDLLPEKETDQPLDPQISARIEQRQKAMALKLERFHLDLSDLAGEEKALRVLNRFKMIIPPVLIGEGGSVSPAHPYEAHNVSPAGTADKPPEVPLGSGAAALPDLDLQVTGDTAGTGSQMEGKEDMMSMMSGMMNMMSSMMGSVPMSGMAGMGAAGDSNGDLPGLLLSTNVQLTQLLSSFASQPNGISPAQLQTINQMLANQAVLLQLLLSRSGTPAASGSMPPMGMGGR